MRNSARLVELLQAEDKPAGKDHLARAFLMRGLGLEPSPPD
jgi:hypothetical protein